MRLHAEFSSEPFTLDRVPDHASVARDLAAQAGVLEAFGTLGTSVAGDAEDVVAALAKVLAATIQHGASGVTLRVGRDSTVLRGVHDLDFTDGLRTLLGVSRFTIYNYLNRSSPEQAT